MNDFQKYLDSELSKVNTSNFSKGEKTPFTKKSFLIKLCNTLYEERVIRNLSREQLAELVSFSATDIIAFERGLKTPTLDQLIELAEIFCSELILNFSPRPEFFSEYC